MKKLLIPLLFMFTTFGLIACSNDNEGGITGDNDTNTMYEDRKTGDTASDQKNKKFQNQSADSLEKENLPDGYLGRGIAKLEEIPTIDKQIDLKKLVAEVESDIPNKRIILFKNNDTNALVYKSIYIKDDQHLKIVELTKDRIIFNGTLIK